MLATHHNDVDALALILALAGVGLILYGIVNVVKRDFPVAIFAGLFGLALVLIFGPDGFDGLD